MLSRIRLSAEAKAYIRLLHNQRALSYRKIGEICNCSAATVHNIVKKPLRSIEVNKRSTQVLKGRPRKVNSRQGRAVIRALYKLRKTEGNFTVKRIMKEAGISEADVSVRTVSRYLNSKGYYSLVARRKGLMTERDRKLRVSFARRIKKQFPENVWTNHVGFYLDGVSFVHKTRPLDQAIAPRGKIWRKKAEGLEPGCTAKGHKSGTGGKQVKLIVALSHNQGVVLCEKYDHMNGAFFATFIENHFAQAFIRANKGRRRLWLQDGDPSQNSAEARLSMAKVHAELLQIPPRSPELNPCENFFKIVLDQLRHDAITKKIVRENYAQFTERVMSTIMNIPIALINKLIASMNRRINASIKCKGKR